MDSYEIAVRRIRENLAPADFVGPRSEELVKSAEAALGLTFSPTYRRFLLEFGAGAFGSQEIYGVLGDNFRSSGVPDGIWFTLLEREQAGLPRHLVIVYDMGDGEWLCLNRSIKDSSDESPITAFQPGFSAEAQSNEVVSENFGSFLLMLTNWELHPQHSPDMNLG